MSINQRFEALLKKFYLSQTEFCDLTKMDSRTVSNIKTGKTSEPKHNFFEAIARHFPDYLFWIILGEKQYLPVEGEGIGMVMKEPEPPAYGTRKELEQLLDTVKKQSDTIAQLTMMVNGLPAILERLERMERALADKKKE